MKTYLCDPNPDPEKREEPKEQTSVLLQGGWTFHAYSASHNRKAAIVFHRTGFEVMSADGQKVFLTHSMATGEQGTYWSPDSRYVTFWTRARPPRQKTGPLLPAVGLLELSKVSKELDKQPAPLEILYVAPDGNEPYGLEWSPKGDDVYVLERFREGHSLFSRLLRVPLKGGKVKEVFRTGGLVDFFMPPVSRFEHGQGRSGTPYWIIFGHARGLFITDPDGRHLRRVADVPAIGLHNVEWNPNPRKNQIALYFRHGVKNSKGKRFKGVHIVHLERLGTEKPIDDQVYDLVNVHTLWYSPKGTYLSWATPSTIYVHRVGDPLDAAVKIQPTQDGLPLEVKGVTWHEDEKMIAYTAGANVYVHELGKKLKPGEQDLLIWTFPRRGDSDESFTAEPIWVGNRVFLTYFQDLRRPKKKPEPKKSEPKKSEPKKSEPKKSEPAEGKSGGGGKEGGKTQAPQPPKAADKKNAGS